MSRLVYSSEHGRMCPECQHPIAQCACKKTRSVGDGKVRVRRETKGRGGKTVSSVTGLPLEESALKELATKLKRRCGTGGSLKDGVIEIQGDFVEVLVDELKKQGFDAKRAGG